MKQQQRHSPSMQMQAMTGQQQQQTVNLREMENKMAKESAAVTKQILKKAKSNPVDESCVECRIQTVTVNVFFDGTGNNYYNANKRRGEDSSYGNNLSNVARMWNAISSDSSQPSVYIDGIGTTRHQSDSSIGAALGAGDTGVDTRARSAFREVVKKVTAVVKDKTPIILTLNVFGFSRGAAAARLFVYLAKTEAVTLFSPLVLKDSRALVNFVGLFDTVVSVNNRFASNSPDLHQTINPAHVNKVVHLTAGDEFREKFACTTIANAGKKGYEFRIPGSHSDVGGGYHDDAPEQMHIEGHNADVRGFVYDKGWYTVAQRTPNTNYLARVVDGDYYRVALSIMTDKANQSSGIDFPSSLTAPANDTLVRKLQSKLRGIAKSKSMSVWDLDAELGEVSARVIRNRVLHVSFTDDGIMQINTGFHRLFISG